MGCGESKHAVATANTTVTKSKSKRSSDTDNPPPVQNASNESVNAKENEIPDAISIKKEAEATENGDQENTLANQENIENGESGEGGEGNPKTPSDKTKEGDGKNQLESEENCAGGEEEDKLNSCDHSPRHFFSPTTSRNHEEESIESAASVKSEEGDPATKNVATNTIDESKVSTSVGEEKTNVEEKENANA